MLPDIDKPAANCCTRGWLFASLPDLFAILHHYYNVQKLLETF